MHHSIHRLRRYCCFFSGEDDFIIRKCNNRIQFRFALIGLFVQAVFILCWFSAALFMSHVFDGVRWISIPAGILWASLVTNLYLLLLYTISPALLPVAGKKKTTIKGKIRKVVTARSRETQYLLLSFSFLTRTGLITFLAIIIAQPFNVWFFAPGYEAADKFATTIQEILSTNPLSRIVTVLFCCIMLLPVYFKYRVRAISRESFEKDFGKEETAMDIHYLRQQLSKPTDHERLSQLILDIDINTIRTSDFYFQKMLLEYRMVLEEYRQFKKSYCHILAQQINRYNQGSWSVLIPYLDKLEQVDPARYSTLYDQLKTRLQVEPIEKYEYWADPPFRTTYKSTNRKLANEAELLQMLYANN